jgi:GT2 family glycosyltransferase
MDVSIIIVNYNTTVLTTECIRSVYKHSKKNSFEIIVVDNASSDRSIAEITTDYPEIHLIQNKKNIGFGSANNQAISISKGKYIFLLNSDTCLKSDAIATFFNYMEDPGHHDIGCCGGELIAPDGSKQVSYGNFPSFSEAISSIGFLVLYRQFYKRNLSSGVFNYSEKIRPVDYICGADMFIRKSVFTESGAFDPEFFLYFEEVELSKRMMRAKYKSVIIPDVKIVHYEGASQSDDKLDVYKVRQFAESRRLYFSKCYGSFSAKVINKIYALQAVCFFLTKRKKAYLKSAAVLFRS